MNVYQTASNFNHTTHHHHYYNQHNLILAPNSSASSIYPGQLLSDDHFYSNIDQPNNNLFHVFMNNEQKLEPKMDPFYYQNSSNFTTFSSPSPSSSYNSNGSGQMIMNWTPNPQTGQEESIVLCQLDELTKSLNNQIRTEEVKKTKLISSNLECSYNFQNVQNDLEQHYDFNSNSIISQRLNEVNLPNSNCLTLSQTTNNNLLIQSQFNSENPMQQSLLQTSQLENEAANNLHPLSTVSQIINSTRTPTTSNIKLLKTSSSVQAGSSYTPVLSLVQSNSMQSNKLNQIIPLNQFPNGKSTKSEINSSTDNISTGNNHHLPANTIIGYDSEGRPIRTTANKKERRRTLSINTAFSNLRGRIPNVPSDTKLSKIKTLRLATSYIAYLMELLDDSAPSNGKRNRLMMTCEDFKVDLQRFKGRSKIIHLIPKINDKQFNRKSGTNDNLNPNNNIYLSQQQHSRIPSTFHQSANLNSSGNFFEDNKCEEIKATNICTNPAIQPYQVPSIDQYDQANKRIKGQRSGWPSHVIKNVWASELHEISQN